MKAAMQVTGLGLLNLVTSGMLATSVSAGCPMGGGRIAMPGHASLDTAAGRDLLFANTGPLDPEMPLPTDATDFPPLTSAMYDSLMKDLEVLLNTSQDFWPADFGSYRGLFIRFAWHCSGGYRQSDGRGGCDGGRIRFAPEAQWPDNTNLDKAFDILQPLHDKYKEVISWGDLIILAGNVAISGAGGPILGFCGGRRNDPDGSASLPLGPSAVQEQISPCPVNGECEDPLGQSTIGLIYVNPTGPIGATGDPVASASDIRNIFGNMGFDDRESVALIGGGHAFGKCHGACPDGPGPNKIVSPSAPYPGVCEVFPDEARGTGNNTFTSGLEGAWTTIPTQWSNQYFKNLLDYEWRIGESPAGEPQFFPFNFTTGEPGPDIIMLVTDIAFIEDPVYKELVVEYSMNLEALERDFAAVWYRLTTQDMGPVSRCNGPDVPPAQPFQNPLPEAATKGRKLSVSPIKIEGAIKKVLRTEKQVGLVAALAYNCASTFRQTNYVGGCNGARIRFPPQLDFPSNAGAAEALAILDPLFRLYDGAVSAADIIVLAGNVAVEMAGGPDLPFCPGRVDAEDGVTEQDLSPRTYYLDPLTAALDNAKVMGLSGAQYVALQVRPTADSPTISNAIFKTLLANEWVPVLEGDAIAVDPFTGKYRAVGSDIVIPVGTWVLLRDEELRFYVHEFSKSEEALAVAFESAWTFLMTADRFDGPTGNVCA